MQEIDWPKVGQVVTASLPFLLAALALMQSWAASSSARSAKRQTRELAEQVAVMRQQLAIDSEIAMMELNPRFVASAIGRGELGTRSAPNGQGFAPLDEAARQHPDTWVWRRGIRLVCLEASGTLIVSVTAEPAGVVPLTPPPIQFVQGAAATLDLLIPNNIPHQKVEVKIESHLASNPKRVWTQRINCFTNP